MTPRENLLSLMRRRGYEWIPTQFSLCPSLKDAFVKQTGIPEGEIYKRCGGAVMGVEDSNCLSAPKDAFAPYYADRALAHNAMIDRWGVAHEPGMYHLERMVHPLQGIDSADALDEYPFPRFDASNESVQHARVRSIHDQGYAAEGSLQMTIWETAWYMRGMEEMMLDMLEENEIADRIFREVTQSAVFRAQQFARAGVDILFLGDDIGTQSSLMMSGNMYRTWIKPRLKQVIDASRVIKPDILIFYHSCGYVLPLIGDLIEAGIDVLNPVQPESMDFQQVHAEFSGALSFHGGIGTQTTMPFGTAEDVKARTLELLHLGGQQGGILPAPTHVLEPEVPIDNMLAYIETVRDWRHAQCPRI